MLVCFSCSQPLFRLGRNRTRTSLFASVVSRNLRLRRCRQLSILYTQALFCVETDAMSQTSSSKSSGSIAAMSQPEAAEHILQYEKKMSQQLSNLSFASPVTHVYDPLIYAWKAHEWYVRTYAKTTAEIILVGMNPGPWGMAQTGVPFGEVEAMKEFLRMPIDIEIGKPGKENGQRPVDGLNCSRSEVSGRRLWREWAAAHFNNDPHAFFSKFYVHNYCPLMFLESGGRNRTPVQLKVKERQAVEQFCNEPLRALVHALRPKAICGIGGYANDRCKQALSAEIEAGLVLGIVLHPSPASPAANRGWVEQAVRQLEEIQSEIDAEKRDWTQAYLH